MNHHESAYDYVFGGPLDSQALSSTLKLTSPPIRLRPGGKLKRIIFRLIFLCVFLVNFLFTKHSLIFNPFYIEQSTQSSSIKKTWLSFHVSFLSNNQIMDFPFRQLNLCTFNAIKYMLSHIYALIRDIQMLMTNLILSGINLLLAHSVTTYQVVRGQKRSQLLLNVITSFFDA